MIIFKQPGINERRGTRLGVAAGIGAGLAADKLIKPNATKAWTNFVTEGQTKNALKKTAKDVFQLKTAGNIIEKADGTLNNASEIAKAGKKGLENLAKRYNLAFDEKSTADTILAELRTKTDDAINAFTKKIKTARKLNFVAAGAVALGLAGAIIGEIADKTKKTEE